MPTEALFLPIVHLVFFIIALFVPLYIMLLYGTVFGFLIWLVKKIWYFLEHFVWYHIKRFSVDYAYKKFLLPAWLAVKHFTLNYIWGSMKFLWKWTKKIFEYIVKGGKFVVDESIVLGKASYKIAKDVANVIYKIGGEAVSKGISIIEAIWNFIVRQFKDLWKSISSLFSSVGDFFSGIGSFVNDTFSSFIDLF
jgi:hypothetical protein